MRRKLFTLSRSNKYISQSCVADNYFSVTITNPDHPPDFNYPLDFGQIVIFMGYAAEFMGFLS